MATVQARHIVDGVAAAVSFHTTQLGSALLRNQGPAAADAKRGKLRPLSSGRTSEADPAR
jgi:hypothetical protein